MPQRFLDLVVCRVKLQRFHKRISCCFVVLCIEKYKESEDNGGKVTSGHQGVSLQTDMV